MFSEIAENISGKKVMKEEVMNISNDLESFNVNKCNERFNNFLKLHNVEVNRLKGNKNLSSIAI